MKRGEVATLYVGPSHAYGDSGYLDVIGPGETLVVEITLFDWRGAFLLDRFYQLSFRIGF